MRVVLRIGGDRVRNESAVTANSNADYFSDALNDLKAELTVELKKRAHAAAWPEDVIRSLSVEPDEEGTLSAVSSMNEEVILDLEHGLPGEIPRPVIGNFNTDKGIDRKVDDRLNEVLSSILSPYFGEQ